MAEETILIQIQEYPRKKGKSKSFIIKGENYLIASARIQYIYKILEEEEQATITIVR